MPSVSAERSEAVIPLAPQEQRQTAAVMWNVCFLQLSHGDVYVGSAKNLRRRVASHERGSVIAERAYPPDTLKSYIAVRTEDYARARECYF
jgi:predicted GIY-YIG superfamily endonuclease